MAAVQERVRLALGWLIERLSVSPQDMLPIGMRLILRCVVARCAAVRGLWSVPGGAVEADARARFLPRPGVRAGLFAAGDARSAEPALQVLAQCEHELAMLPAEVFRDVMALLGDVDVVPEHLGMLYEGLLDVELCRNAQRFAPSARCSRGEGEAHSALPGEGEREGSSLIETEHERIGQGAIRSCIVRSASGGRSMAAGSSVRKAAGTFYTPFALVLPIVRRTVEPLCYTASLAGNQRQPRRPEEILALTVCDPAMGAGIFLIAALRVLTEALRESVRSHGRLQMQEGTTVCRLDPGAPVMDVAIPHGPEHPDFEALLARGLKRAVALRCLYGVDLDPLALDLGAAALWLEVMDAALPMDAFHDRLRLGNALVGARRDRACDYPVKALARDNVATPSRRHPAGACQPGPAEASMATLQERLDTWCAVWFWPDDAQEPRPTPETFQDPPEPARALVKELARAYRFFHWELAFPAVFAAADAGFAAIVGNPPWETLQPSSKEFFSGHDPDYAACGKQEALERQRALFAADARIEAAWIAYCARFKALSRWYKHATGLCHQGEGKPYSYKLFIEASCALLRPGGRLGFVVPSGLHTDLGTTALRTFLLEQCRWEWLFGFENRQGIFAIDNRFKFSVIVLCKGSATEAVRTAFMHTSLAAWASPDVEHHGMPYPRARIEQLSPRSRVLLELRSERDLQVLQTIDAHAVLLGEPAPRGWGLMYRQGDFNMTSDSRLFPPRPWWEARGFGVQDDGDWRDPAGTVALPLYEGRMLGAFEYSDKGWVRGTGRRATWRPIARDEVGVKPIAPQYLIAQDDFQRHGGWRGLKLGLLAIGSATNARSMVCTSLYDVPCGNAVALLRSAAGVLEHLFLMVILNSFVYDFALRCRLGGINLNAFVIAETPLVTPRSQAARLRAHMGWLAARLAWTHPRYAPMWQEAQVEAQRAGVGLERAGLTSWAIAPQERLRLRCILDAMAAYFYGLESAELAWILRDCDHPVSALRGAEFQRQLDPKGFWRVDKDRDPELRHPVLVQVAFGALKRLGPEAFLALHDGLGWMLPETLRLAEHGLGHDASAREAQPVAERLAARPGHGH